MYSSTRVSVADTEMSAVWITAPTMFWKPLPFESVTFPTGSYTFRSPSIHGTFAEREIVELDAGESEASENSSPAVICVLPLSSETPSGRESVNGVR